MRCPYHYGCSVDWGIFGSVICLGSIYWCVLILVLIVTVGVRADCVHLNVASARAPGIATNKFLCTLGRLTGVFAVCWTLGNTVGLETRKEQGYVHY
jgi:hypothetical protein